MNAALHIPVIDTQRLRLRPHRRDDFEALAVMWATPHARFMDGPLDRHEAWDAFCRDVAGWVLDGFGCWAVDRCKDDAMIGQVGITHPDFFPEPELGWVVFEHATGQGYAREAATAALDFARDTLKWDSVVSYVAPDNAASRTVAERLGARIDNTAPRPVGETAADTLVYRHTLAHSPKGPQ